MSIQYRIKKFSISVWFSAFIVFLGLFVFCYTDSTSAEEKSDSRIKDDTKASASFLIDNFPAGSDKNLVLTAQENQTISPFGFSNKLFAGNHSTLDEFGWSIAMDGDTAIIGDFGEDVGGNPSQGAAYVFVQNNGLWVFQQTLLAPAGSGVSDFGWSVDVEGNTAVVSARNPFGSPGSVFIYVRNGTTWTLQAELTGSPTESFFGPVVAISGDTLVVGSGGTGVVNFTGVAFVFVRNGSSWSFQTKLFASDGAQSDGFGSSVSISGDTVLVGAWQDDVTTPNDNQGSAYIFTRSGASWTQTTKFTTAGTFGFGFSTAIENSTAVVSSAGFADGRVLVYINNGGSWTFQSQLQATDTVPARNFGSKVGLSGDRVVVGAHRTAFGIDSSEGTAYIFTRSGTSWTQTANLSAPDRARNDNFGRAVAIAGTTAIVGAHKDNFFSNTAPGAAYVFSDVSGESPDLQTASDHGTSQSDNITNTRQLTIDVHNATVGSTIELLRNGVVVGSSVAAANTVTFNDTVSADGQFQYNSRVVTGGTPSLPSIALLVSVDTVAPTVTIDQLIGQNDPTSSNIVGFIINLSDQRSDFSSSFVSLAGSTANVSQSVIQTSVSSSGTTFSAMVNNVVSNGQFVRATIPAGMYTDVAGNFNAASTSTDNTVTVDNVRPTVTINQAAAQPDPTRNLPLVFDVVFSESVDSFAANDVSLSGSTANTINASINVSGSGAVYTVSISGITSNGGFIRASIPGNFAVTDTLGNPSFPSTSTDNEITIDNVPPGVTINQAAGQPDPATTQPVNFSVVFSEPVSGFDQSDISLANSTANVSTASVVVTGSGTTYNVAVSSVTSSGIVRASVLPGAAQDAIGNPSLVSTSTDNAVSVTVKSATFADFDGDGKTDISIFRPALGEWWYLRSLNGENYAAQFGSSSDKITPADFTGDGKTDVAFFRPSTGEWFILRSENGSFYSFPFGTNGDIPIAGDFDADGKADAGVFRPSTATWYIGKSTGGTLIQQFGQNGDVPVVGDYDADGKADIAIYRPSAGEWWIQRSSNNSVLAFQFGSSADKPVPADFTGDSKADAAFFRPSTGEWFVLRSEDFSYYSFPFGTNGDIPAAGDYDGDGKFDAAVFRPADAIWYIQRSTAGILIRSFGQSGDVPVPSAFVP